MHYFDSSNNHSVQPMNTPPQQSNFQLEYNGVLHGLMSSVQMAYTGISMLYFCQNIKTIASDFKQMISPIISKAIRYSSPKAALIFIYRSLHRFFESKSTAEDVIKFGLLPALLLTLYFYYIVKIKQREAIQKKVDWQKRTIQGRTSEEFWQH